jgi:hypothetical protein
VEAGLDNSPDPRAISLKYGKFGKEHAGENISPSPPGRKEQYNIDRRDDL